MGVYKGTLINIGEMVRLQIEITEKEHREALKAKGRRTWREVLLGTGINTPFKKNRIGRPARK